MKFDCNLNLESFHWIVDCEEQQVAALMLSLLLVLRPFLLQMFSLLLVVFSLVLVMFCLSFGICYLRCFLSRDVFSAVCGIFFVACNIMIFVVSVFFVVTTPS